MSREQLAVIMRDCGRSLPIRHLIPYAGMYVDAALVSRPKGRGYFSDGVQHVVKVFLLQRRVDLKPK